MSGLSTRRFCFEGFLPTDKKEREPVLARLGTETRTTVFYEAPHRLLKTLQILQEAAGPERQIAVCRELTKLHETVFRGSLAQTIDYYTQNPPKGEIVLVLEGASEEALAREKEEAFAQLPLAEHMQRYLDQGMSKKEAMKAVAADRGVSKREIYQQLLEEEGHE
jgi:16S rRNA (cytidine1402-2'-O)-methyltransferase